MPGRGAYLCGGGAAAQPAADCLNLATRRRALARALRSPSIRIPDAVSDQSAAIDRKLVESVSLD
jgi:predicted RNA-binding protein YlxR (DUF448 family)